MLLSIEHRTRQLRWGAITSRIDKQVYKVTMISFVCQYVEDRWGDTLVYLSESRMGFVIMLKPLVTRKCNYRTHAFLTSLFQISFTRA
jgi:hypothetical protein